MNNKVKTKLNTVKEKMVKKTILQELKKIMGWEMRKRQRPIGKGKYKEYGKTLCLSKCHGCEINYKALEQLFLSKLKEVRLQTLKEVEKEIKWLRDTTLEDEEFKEGKSWYDKNYWTNRLLDKLAKLK